MTDYMTYEGDLRAVACAYIEQRESGSLDYTAFLAAISAYRERHPDTNNSDAAQIVSDLMQEMPRASCY
ncbi:MAG: hypothetical protein HOM25_05490 [Rhodospirillaceae bacterium]|jgi:hypothetical protein|nr:hypothetical protein [Rhodospirillaceae bacterium]MBT5666036.1 hypothetical protein [Rhodospirillaceae bacterium]